MSRGERDVAEDYCNIPQGKLFNNIYLTRHFVF